MAETNGHQEGLGLILKARKTPRAAKLAPHIIRPEHFPGYGWIELFHIPVRCRTYEFMVSP
jgi:hypothetical protein